MNELIERVRVNFLNMILSDQAEKAKNVDISAVEANDILEKLLRDNSDILTEKDLKKMTVELSTYGKSVEFSSIPDKKVYSALIMALTELYGSGEREKLWNDTIQYTFKKITENWNDRIYITAKVSTELTGCKLVTKMVNVPERVIPAHMEEETEVKCSE